MTRSVLPQWLGLCPHLAWILKDWPGLKTLLLFVFCFLNFSWQQTSHSYRKVSQILCVANEAEEAQRVRWQESHLWRPSIYFAKRGRRLESLWVVVCPHCVEQIVTHSVDKLEEILHFSLPVVFGHVCLKRQTFCCSVGVGRGSVLQRFLPCCR